MPALLASHQHFPLSPAFRPSPHGPGGGPGAGAAAERARELTRLCHVGTISDSVAGYAERRSSLSRREYSLTLQAIKGCDVQRERTSLPSRQAPPRRPCSRRSAPTCAEKMPTPQRIDGNAVSPTGSVVAIGCEVIGCGGRSARDGEERVEGDGADTSSGSA